MISLSVGYRPGILVYCLKKTVLAKTYKIPFQESNVPNGTPLCVDVFPQNKKMTQNCPQVLQGASGGW